MWSNKFIKKVFLYYTKVTGKKERTHETLNGSQSIIKSSNCLVLAIFCYPGVIKRPQWQIISGRPRNRWLLNAADSLTDLYKKILGSNIKIIRFFYEKRQMGIIMKKDIRIFRYLVERKLLLFLEIWWIFSDEKCFGIQFKLIHIFWFELIAG